MEAKNEDLLGEMAERLPEEDTPGLKAAFRRLADFTFNVDDKLLPHIRRKLYVLDPDDDTGVYTGEDGMGSWAPDPSVNAKAEVETVAAHLRGALDETAAQVLYQLRDLGDVDHLWGRIVFSVLEDFVDQIAWRDEAETEWDILLRAYGDSLWADANAERMAAAHALNTWRRRTDDVVNTLPSLGGADA